MKGINNAEHQQLIACLLQLENLLRSQEADRHQAAGLRTELAAMHENYNKQLAALEKLIGDYHDLFKKTKTTFLSPKLKALKKGRTPSRNLRVA